MMKNLLVAYNGLEASDAALAGALMLRAQADAHLTGLLAHGGSSVLQRIQKWMPDSVRRAVEEIEGKAAREIEQRFRVATADVPVDRLHWIDSTGRASASVSIYARRFDITVVGVHEDAPEYGQDHLELHPDGIALQSGRPVMVFPAGSPRPIVDGRVMIAWDGSRAAARAVGDAADLLGTARAVEVVSVGRPPTYSALPGIDIATALRRRGVEVQLTELQRGKRSVADVLVDHGVASGAALLVMGAYEHSRFREDLFGGVTHDISLRARIPVLMSH